MALGASVLATLKRLITDKFLHGSTKMHIILLYSGNPLPAMLEIGFVAVNRGVAVDLLLVDRAQRDLSVDNKLVNYPLVRIVSPYNGLDARRILSFPLTFFRVARTLIAKSRRQSVVITSTLDMLLVARVVGFFADIRIRHQVRDLHSLQLANGIASRALQKFESWLLKPCELLIYSAPAFFDEYYAKIYNGRKVLLENLPQPVAWEGFSSTQLDSREFKIGYIGIIRYMNPLKNLVAAIEKLSNNERRYTALFAGGGNAAEIQKHVRSPDLFNFIGRFEYTSEVAKLHKDIDLIYAVYDRFDRNCQIAMPTKFYEALITRIPIMVSKDTYVGDLVEEMGIGIAVDGESADALVAAFSEIRFENSWYAKARARLGELNIQDWYDAYHKALDTVITSEI